MQSIPSLRVTSKQALQAYLWNQEHMTSFVEALRHQGFALLIPQNVQERGQRISADSILSWFGNMPLAVQQIPRDQVQGGLSVWRLYRRLETHRDAVQPLDDIRELLHDLALADFVSAANEMYTYPNHYKDKVKAWFTTRCAMVEKSTGVEYFAQFRDGFWMMVSIGLQSASDRGKVTLRQFVYEGAELSPDVLHDFIGFNDMQKLRDFLHDTICILAGPNMSLVHDVYLESLGHSRYITIELCREVQGFVFEHGDLSYITRNPAGFLNIPRCNVEVAAEAMRTVFDDEHEQCMGSLFENDSVSMAIYKKYDIAKAVRVIPHAFAANRRRYAGIASQRDLVVPTASTARYNLIKPTERIRSINKERVPINREWSVLFAAIFLSIAVAGASGYGVSKDERVSAADIVSVILTILVLMMVSVPQLYVAMIGGDYTIGEFYRACVPVSACLRRYDVAFLKECVKKGVDVEKSISGRHGCFLMLKARGNLEVGPVQIRDLDDRWDYGINTNGELCMRYRGTVGVMQVCEKICDKTGKVLLWWHCAVVDSVIKKGVNTGDVLRVLGDGEVG